MNNDIGIIKNDLRVIMSNLSPELPLDVIEIRLEEVLYKYDIQKKTFQELENDFQEKLNAYLSAKRLEGLSENTLKDYRLEIGLFMRTNKKATSQIQTPDIRNYLGSLENIEISTMAKKLNVLKSFFGWMVEEEILLRDPTTKIKMPKKKKRIPKGLTVNELELVRESCITKRQRALIEVFYSTGCRLSEIAGMSIEKINKNDMSTTVIGKGSIERKVYLNFKAMYHLEAYLKTRNDDCEFLFVSQRKPIRQMSNAAIQDEFIKIKKFSGLTKKFHPHVMRHSLAQTMLDNGAKLEEVQHILGHAGIQTTQIYTNISEERKQQSHKRYA